MSATLSIPEAKHAIRQEMRRLRDALSKEERVKRSRRAFQRLEGIPLYRNAALVLFYASFGSEVDTWEAIERCLKSKKRVALPRVEGSGGRISAFEISDPGKDLQAGYKGIREPVEGRTRRLKQEEIDLILVPALAFDERGYRLGYGKGFYDRFLSGLSLRIPSVGMGFDFQVLDILPTSSADFPLDYIMTEEQWILGRKKGPFF